MPAAGLQPADDPRHAEEGQPGPQGGPLGAGIRGEVGPGGDVRREEEAFQNVDVPLVPVIEQGVPALRGIVYPGVLHHRQHRGHQQHAGNAQSQHRFQGQEQEVPQGDIPASGEHPHKPIDDAEGHLPHKEVVID